VELVAVVREIECGPARRREDGRAGSRLSAASCRSAASGREPDCEVDMHIVEEPGDKTSGNAILFGEPVVEPAGFALPSASVSTRVSGTISGALGVSMENFEMN